VKRLWTALFLAGCSPAVESPRVSVMTFNVENLFDAKHDPGKEDWAFLPLTEKAGPRHAAACARAANALYREQCLRWDWSQIVLETKLSRIAAAILQVGGGRGPDVLLLQEVENKEILERLGRDYLGPAGYETAALLEGDDSRGVDQAILSRLPAAGPPRLLRDPEGALSRGVLVQPLTLPDGAVLDTASVHFPSPARPRVLREQGFAFLESWRRGRSPEALLLVGGDFNVSAEEDARFGMFARAQAAGWAVSHELGCAECAGTNYYAAKRSWSFLDAILLPRTMAAGGGGAWRADPGSVRVLSEAPGQKDARGAPMRFDPQDGSGVSDHFPLILELVKRR